MLAESSDGILTKGPRFDSSVRADDNTNPSSLTLFSNADSTRGGKWDKQLATSSRTPNSSFSQASKSPWVFDFHDHSPSNSHGRLMGSLVRQEGHIYSLAAFEDLLYTGSDSKNIRVWKNKKEFSGFKANSGLVKSIVISGGARIFTGHQDGRIRVWNTSKRDVAVYKRIGMLPTMKALIKSSMRPSSFMETRRHSRVPWIKHFDAISSLSLSEDESVLYSASWDRTVKVWRVSNFTCLESISAHDDAVNAVVSGFDGLVFTGSADGSVKVWRREVQGKGTKHFFSQTLLKQECAVTAVAVDPAATVVYCGSSDCVVYYWERGNFSGAYGRLSSHKLAVLCLSTAGSLVLSGSADMNICIWKRVDAGPQGHVFLSTLTGHNGPVKCLAVERDRDAAVGDTRWILYSGSLDKSVKIWQILEHVPAEQFAGGEDPSAIGHMNCEDGN